MYKNKNKNQNVVCRLNNNTVFLNNSSIYTLEYQLLSYISTFATVAVGISRVTSPVTAASLSVTWIVVQTLTTAVFDTIISIRPISTNYACENV